MRTNSTDHWVGRPAETAAVRQAALAGCRMGQSVAVTVPLGREQPEIEIGMPTAFAAFCASRLDVYTRYASLRLRDKGLARRTVQVALGDLAMVWAEALESSSPPALAWRLLTSRTGRAAVGCDPVLYRVLPTEQADVMLLRYCLGLPTAQAADVMGWSAARFARVLSDSVRTVSADKALG
ncbi:hypothetical protein [Streptomyces sp. NPDC046985]|uniref:hypothetical protein n=1 Tax=Streptomyces sp. NPDC046985 TaxID=3155377 RepID=UPI0033C6B199